MSTNRFEVVGLDMLAREFTLSYVGATWYTQKWAAFVKKWVKWWQDAKAIKEVLERKQNSGTSTKCRIRVSLKPILTLKHMLLAWTQANWEWNTVIFTGVAVYPSRGHRLFKSPYAPFNIPWNCCLGIQYGARIFIKTDNRAIEQLEKIYYWCPPLAEP